jgi:hypothetical protein
MKLFPTELIEISCLFSSLKMQRERGREGDRERGRWIRNRN